VKFQAKSVKKANCEVSTTLLSQ